MRQEFPHENVPEKSEDINPSYDGDAIGEIFFRVDDWGLNLSTHINWVFTNLDESFERAFGRNDRPMFVHLSTVKNYGDEQIKEYRRTLLRMIPYSLDRCVYEPKIYQYHYVPSTMKIIELQVLESDVTRLDFEPGETIISLFFEYE